MTSRHNQKQGPISLNKKGHVDKLLRLKRKPFAQIMTQGRPAGRIGGKYPWCQSTLFSYKKRHAFFPHGRFFGVLGFLRRLARGKDYSFYFYFIIIPQGTFGGNSDDSWDNKQQVSRHRWNLQATTNHYAYTKTISTAAQINSYQLPRSSKGVLIGLRDQTTKEEGSCHEHPTSCQRASSRQPDTPHHLSSSVAVRSGIPIP